MLQISGTASTRHPTRRSGAPAAHTGFSRRDAAVRGKTHQGDGGQPGQVEGPAHGVQPLGGSG